MAVMPTILVSVVNAQWYSVCSTGLYVCDSCISTQLHTGGRAAAF